MGPYESSSAESEWFRDRDSRCPPAEIDSQLANAGYRVRSSDLRHVAQRLERLESAMASGTSRDSGDGLGLAAPLDQQLLTAASEAVHYNPADLASWVDSMISEFAPDPPVSHHERTEELLEPVPCTSQHQQKQQRQQPLPVYPQQVTQPEEDNGIRLVHLLMTCAESVQRGEVRLASSLVEEMRLLLGRVNTKVGIGKVAGYFIDALTRRLYTSQAACAGSAPENEFLYHHFYEACPYLKFAHFTTNQAILEAFNGHDFVHVIDFNLMQGLQWPALIQALALRPGGPPFLRLTGIGPPSPDGRDSIREVGLRLAELARSVHVRFAFRGVAVSRLDDVRPWMLQVQPNEAVAVNSVMRLHRLLAEPETIESVLGLIRRLKPKIVTVVEQEADHNKPGFLDRFTEALFYYSTLFDSLAAGMGGGGDGAQQTQRAMAEVYLQREICNIVCCEGPARVERHEPLARWRVRMGQAGFKETHLGSNAFKQASMLLTLFSVEGYCVEEVDGCLTLGWHSRPLISASAWRADEEDNDVAPYPAAVTILNSANPNYNSSHHHLNNSITTNNIGSNCTGSSSGSSTVSNAMVQ